MSLPSLPGLSAVDEPRQVGLVSVAHGVNEFYSIAVPPILPLVVAEFPVSLGEAGLLVTAYFAMYVLFQLPAGYAADRVGGTRLVAAGLLVLAGGTLLSSLASSFEWVVAGQVVAGVGGSTYHPAGMSLVSDVESAATEGRAMGVHGVAGTGGTLLAPIGVGGAAALWGWRTALGGAAAVGVVYAVVFAVLATEPTHDERIDGNGTGTDVDGTDDDSAAASETDVVETGHSERPDGGHRLGSLRGRLGRLSPVPLASWVVGLFLLKFLFTLQSGAVRTYAVAFVFARTGGAVAGVASVGATLPAASVVAVVACAGLLLVGGGLRATD